MKKLTLLLMLICNIAIAQVADHPTKFTDRSGTATTTSAVAAVAAVGRNILIFQNIGSNVIYINFGAAATVDSNSIKLGADAVLFMDHYCSYQSVNVITASGSSKYILKTGE